MAESTEEDARSEPPIEIESDRADLDAERGISIYSGDAVLSRGPLRITGDVMEVYTDPDGALQRVVVEGNPATYHDHPEGLAEPVRGEAQTMEYFASAPERAALRGAARLWQGQDEITGETIDIDLERQLVEARGDESRRARTVLYPARREDR